jgi:hypothetical protein
MTALRMALLGEPRPMTLRGAICGKAPISTAGMMANVFEVNDSQCFAGPTHDQWRSTAAGDIVDFCLNLGG